MVKIPFKLVSHGKHKGKYRSDSGKIYTRTQMRLYRVTEGFTKSSRKWKRKK